MNIEEYVEYLSHAPLKVLRQEQERWQGLDDRLSRLARIAADLKEHEVRVVEGVID